MVGGDRSFGQQRQAVAAAHVDYLGQADDAHHLGIEIRVVVQLVNVIVDAEPGADDPVVGDAVGEADSGLELLLRGIVELIDGADLVGHVLKGLVEAVAPLAAAPQTGDVSGGRVVLPAKTEVESELSGGLPVVLKVETEAILADVGEGEAFRRISGGGRAQHEGGEGVVGKVAVEVEPSARNVGRATE